MIPSERHVIGRLANLNEGIVGNLLATQMSAMKFVLHRATVLVMPTSGAHRSAQHQAGHAQGEIDAHLPFERDRLQRYRIVGTADQNIRAAAEA
jgi:hypothetical protein